MLWTPDCLPCWGSRRACKHSKPCSEQLQRSTARATRVGPQPGGCNRLCLTGRTHVVCTQAILIQHLCTRCTSLATGSTIPGLSSLAKRWSRSAARKRAGADQAGCSDTEATQQRVWSLAEDALQEHLDSSQQRAQHHWDWEIFRCGCDVTSHNLNSTRRWSGCGGQLDRTNAAVPFMMSRAPLGLGGPSGPGLQCVLGAGKEGQSPNKQTMPLPSSTALEPLYN